jgi:lipopolysaccharide transport system ATP-binding protein
MTLPQQAQEPVIRLQNVQKAFRLQENQPTTLLEQIIQLVRPNRYRRKRHRDLQAISGLSLEVMPGETLGILGRNGSGKSTLLKLISRILRPDQGRIEVYGRVSALLELGVGFHPDLTGRENIYLNAALLGLSREEIDDHFESVVAFSELGEFIDVPVKYYSSGMYMRLGFSVASHVDPDVLIVDEILAVGDQTFQEKCIQHIQQLKHRGVTIILVSHNADMVRRLCSRAIWMDDGRLQADGDAVAVVQQYLEHMYASRPSGRRVFPTGSFERWGTGEIEITGVRFLNTHNEEQEQYRTGEPLTVELSYDAHRPVAEPEFGLAIYRQDGTHVNGPNNQLAGLNIGTVSGTGIVRYEIEQLLLLPARYEVTVAVHDSYRSHAYDYHQRAYSFDVIAGGTRELHGLVALPARWRWLPEPEERSGTAPHGEKVGSRLEAGTQP